MHNPDSGRILYLDCHDGVAGDMILAALIGLGVPQRLVEREIKKLGIPGWRLRVEKAERSHLAGFRATVDIKEDIQPERRWADIRRMIRNAPLSEGTRSRALAIFTTLAHAEAEVHGTTADRVHFHEIGAVDSIVDIVGVAAALDHLDAEVMSSAVPVGRGHVMTRHGLLPLPAPATLRILAGVPIVGRTEEAEFTTPTGAAILKSQATSFGPMPAMIPEAMASGIGTRPKDHHPGMLRAVLGRRLDAPGPEPDLWQIEANLDDSTGEILSHAVEALLKAGALDAWLVPVIMKKGRPAVMLGVLCETEDRDKLIAIVLQETTTLGVRFHAVHRRAVARTIVRVKTRYGTLPVKVAGDPENPLNVHPEFEACRKAAFSHKVPLKEVMAAAVSAERGARSTRR